MNLLKSRKGFYKIRPAIKSRGKGKRGGARVITYVKVAKTAVFLVSIFDKYPEKFLFPKRDSKHYLPIISRNSESLQILSFLIFINQIN